MTNHIKMFFHCADCLEELPEGQSPADWARLAVGWTEVGLQVWCNRHEANIIHIHFDGQKHNAASGDEMPQPSRTLQ